MADPFKARFGRLTDSFKTVLSGLPEAERRDAVEALYSESGPILFSFRVSRSLNVFEVEAWEDFGDRKVSRSGKSLGKVLREVNHAFARFAIGDEERRLRKAEATTNADAE